MKNSKLFTFIAITMILTTQLTFGAENKKDLEDCAKKQERLFHEAEVKIKRDNDPEQEKKDSLNLIPRPNNKEHTPMKGLKKGFDD